MFLHLIYSATNATHYVEHSVTPVDKVVFLADKIESDNPGLAREYGRAVEEALAQSLDAACLAYLQFVVQHAGRLGWPLHPDLVEAHGDLVRVMAEAAPAPLPRARVTRQSRPRTRAETKRKEPRFVITGPLVARSSEPKNESVS